MNNASNDTILRYYPGTLAASAIVAFEAYGDYIFLQANSGTDGTLKVSFDNNAEVTLVVGVILKLKKPFTRIFIRNTDTVSATFAVMCGLGEIDYKALVLSGTIVVSPAQSTTGTFASDNSVSTVEQIFTSATKKRVVVQADVTNTDYVHIGFDNSTTTSKKVYTLDAGEKMELIDYIGDLWAIANSGTQKVSVSSW